MSELQRATIKTIAKEANVTPNTVSLALRNSPLVKAETMRLITAIAKRQGYVPNVIAESLRSGRSKLIALVFGDVGNPLFAMKIKKLEKVFHDQNYQVMILNTNENPELEMQAIRTAISRNTDGVILCPCQHGREALDMLHQYQVPCVLIGRSFDDEKEDSVVWDNFNGGYLATKYLLSLGCKDILCLLGPHAISTSGERRDGYVSALVEAGIVPDSSLQIEPILGRVDNSLKSIAVSYDGVFAFSDILAWEAACHLPDGFPIIGFDNVLEFFSLPFSMSSIAANLDEEAKQVMNLLLGRIEAFDRPVSKIVLPVDIVVR